LAIKYIGETWQKKNTDWSHDSKITYERFKFSTFGSKSQ
jgi:hypothetical protein